MNGQNSNCKKKPSGKIQSYLDINNLNKIIFGETDLSANELVAQVKTFDVTSGFWKLPPLKRLIALDHIHHTRSFLL